MKSLSRRSVLGLTTRGVSAVALTMAGLVPGPDPHAAPSGDIARGRQFVLSRAKGAAKEARLAVDLRDAVGTTAAAFLASEGFTPRVVDSDAADLSWSDGEHVGRLDQLVFHDERRDRYARLTRQVSGATQIVGIAIWDAVTPDRRVVYELRAGAFTKTADLYRDADGGVDIVGTNGKRTHVAPMPGRASATKGPGLASVSADTFCTTLCTWQCSFVCDWVCTTVLVETCVISALCGPGAFICAGFCVVAVIASCAYNCTNYCGWACSTTCTYLEG